MRTKKKDGKMVPLDAQVGVLKMRIADLEARIAALEARPIVNIILEAQPPKDGAICYSKRGAHPFDWGTKPLIPTVGRCFR